MMLEMLDRYYPMWRLSIEDSPGQENIILNHSKRHPNKREFSVRLWNHREVYPSWPPLQPPPTSLHLS